MDPLILQLVLVGSVSLVGLLLVIQPRIARRGLLFGVYVGEERWNGPEAASVTRRWYAGMAIAALAGLAAGEAVAGSRVTPPLGVVVALLTLSAGSSIVYLVAHLDARKLAVVSTRPAAAMVGGADPSLAWPLTALAWALAAGSVSIAYAWWHFDRLPPIVPTHFGSSGAPDAWSPRSFGSVMLVPVTTLLVGGALAIIACLTARAKRAIRHPDDGVSFAAQQRFRSATAAFLSGAAILATLLLTVVGLYSLRTGLGLAAGMPGWLPVLVGLLVAYSVGGALYLSLRLGQGGARLERRVGTAPLTNGLADNSHWVLGMFYVNRDDPSLFVEKRFGLGYTINFGNPRAVALLAIFLAVVVGIWLVGR
jgi:uncharacterized membrane protein